MVFDRRGALGDQVLNAGCIAVQGMVRANRDTLTKQFYEKKAKSIGAPKAQVAAVRRLVCAIRWMLPTTNFSRTKTRR